MHDTPNGGVPTSDILFLRGKTGPGTTDVTPLPPVSGAGFVGVPEPAALSLLGFGVQMWRRRPRIR